MSNYSSNSATYFKSEEARLLDAIRYILTLIKDQGGVAAFAGTPGGSKVYVYYTGVEGGNPSGETDNIKTITYNRNGQTLYTETYTYNVDNKILSTTIS